MSDRHIVFDIGRVLVDWHPHLAWMDSFGTREAVDAFLDRTGFFEKNLRADGGETFADLASEIDDPTDAAEFTRYLERYALTIQDPIDGTWQILEKLKAQHIPVHAITNWSAETWPVGVRTHPRLGEVFDVLIVSGEEGLLKPDARIFELLCARAGVKPSDCVFIDDSPQNVAGAKGVGMDAIHFTSPDALQNELSYRGLP